MDNRIFHDPVEKVFEEFEEGDVMITRGRTLDIGDISNFAGLTGDHYQLHTDEAHCEGTRFGTRIAHGPLTFSLAIGLVAISGFYGNAIVALVEVHSLRALKPVVPGDTIRVRATVVRKETGSSSRYGTLHVNYSVLNQRDEEVMNFLQIMLARRKKPSGD